MLGWLGCQRGLVTALRADGTGCILTTLRSAAGNDSVVPASKHSHILQLKSAAAPRSRMPLRPCSFGCCGRGRFFFFWRLLLAPLLLFFGCFCSVGPLLSFVVTHSSSVIDVLSDTCTTFMVHAPSMSVNEKRHHDKMILEALQ